MLPRPRSVLDDPTLFERHGPVPRGHSNTSTRYIKRNVGEGFKKQMRLETIEEALRDRIGLIAQEFIDFPDHFRDVTSIHGLLDVNSLSIEEVD